MIVRCHVGPDWPQIGLYESVWCSGCPWDHHAPPEALLPNVDQKIIGELYEKIDKCWAIVMVNLWKSYGQKLRGNIPVHFGLITFRFAYGRTLKPLISMISGFSNVSLGPKTNIIYLLRDQDTLEKPRNLQVISEKIISTCWKSRNFAK